MKCSRIQATNLITATGAATCVPLVDLPSRLDTPSRIAHIGCGDASRATSLHLVPVFRGDAEVREIDVVVDNRLVLKPNDMDLAADVRGRDRVGIEDGDTLHLDLGRQACLRALKHPAAGRHVETHQPAAVNVRDQIEMPARRERAALHAGRGQSSPWLLRNSKLYRNSSSRPTTPSVVFGNQRHAVDVQVIGVEMRAVQQPVPRVDRTPRTIALPSTVPFRGTSGWMLGRA